MRFVSRALGLLLAAAAFVAFVVDGARSIADDAVQFQPIGAAWVYASEASFVRAQAAIQRDLSPVLWENVVLPVLNAPFFTLLLAFAVLFLWLGRRPRPRIGYVTRG